MVSEGYRVASVLVLSPDMSQQLHWPPFLRQLHALEQSWNSYKVTYPREDAVHFLPFPIPQFVSMLTDAVMAAPITWTSDQDGPAPARFIDVGCGPGTKVRLAQALFGLEGYGIDIIPTFIDEARSCGVKADLTDAFDFSRYGEFDIVFANRPSTLQDELERHILVSMADEAVVIAANWRNSPSAGWSTGKPLGMRLS